MPPSFSLDDDDDDLELSVVGSGWSKATPKRSALSDDVFADMRRNFENSEKQLHRMVTERGIALEQHEVCAICGEHMAPQNLEEHVKACAVLEDDGVLSDDNGSELQTAGETAAKKKPPEDDDVIVLADEDVFDIFDDEEIVIDSDDDGLDSSDNEGDDDATKISPAPRRSVLSSSPPAGSLFISTMPPDIQEGFRSLMYHGRSKDAALTLPPLDDSQPPSARRAPFTRRGRGRGRSRARGR